MTHFGLLLFYILKIYADALLAQLLTLAPRRILFLLVGFLLRDSVGECLLIFLVILRILLTLMLNVFGRMGPIFIRYHRIGPPHTRSQTKASHLLWQLLLLAGRVVLFFLLLKETHYILYLW